MTIEDTLRNAVRQLEADKARLNHELGEAKARELNAKEAEKSALRKLDEARRDLASRLLPAPLQPKTEDTFEPHDLKPKKK